ncbi:MAG: two pore domain potassium channel family protein [Flavobacteriales bacterium]|nr:two pore domain potassium channel family protein [Flavobacteriales bacterium]MCB9194402.1 two pore domain potassium channel family protein [Flavobacteriales bacterium]
MKEAIRKLMMGRGQGTDVPRYSTIHRRLVNIRAIWNNDLEEDAGLEKFVRLLLACSQLVFPGTYIRHLFWRQGPMYQDLAIDLFVLLKTALPLVIMYEGWQDQLVLFWLAVWFMLETVTYIPTLIFASDAFPTPRSYRRSKMLLLFNYLEVVFTFGLIHIVCQDLNKPILHWIDAIYFSLVTTSTIGYGDLFPVTMRGKLLVMAQSLFYLSYIVLFINVFSFGMKRGYFEQGDKRS